MSAARRPGDIRQTRVSTVVSSATGNVEATTTAVTRRGTATLARRSTRQFRTSTTSGTDRRVATNASEVENAAVRTFVPIRTTKAVIMRT